MFASMSTTAVVTGAGSGIGRSIALALAHEGGRVCLVGRTLEKLEAVVAAAGNCAGKITTHRVDLGDESETRSLALALERELGGLDLLVHSAGEIFVGGIENASLQEFDRQYRVNVRAPYLLCQVFLPALKRGRGQVVFINSSAGLSARGGVAQYAATKHALKAIADSLREEVNKDGVRVLSVYPGRTATPMQENVCREEGKNYHPERLMQPEDVAVTVLNAVGLPRTAEITDLNIRPMEKT